MHCRMLRIVTSFYKGTFGTLTEVSKFSARLFHHVYPNYLRIASCWPRNVEQRSMEHVCFALLSIPSPRDVSRVAGKGYQRQGREVSLHDAEIQL